MVDRRGIGLIVAGTSGRGVGASGWISGTTLGLSFWIGWAIYSITATLASLLEIGSSLRILESLKVAAPAWQAWTSGWSSIVALVALFPAIWILATLTRPTKAPAWRIIAIQTPAAAAFWVLHYAGYSLVRLIVYRLFGTSYAVESDPILYELPRDLSVYAVVLGCIWTAAFLRDRAAPSAVAGSGPALFDIRDNAHVIRVPTDDILAVSSAGNYVEFQLKDGRKPLMRATLAGVEARLKPHGFTRTHRSWLANTARVAEIKPTGSGDFTLVLQGGLAVPLSRRFRQDFDTQGGALDAR